MTGGKRTRVAPTDAPSCSTWRSSPSTMSSNAADRPYRPSVPSGSSSPAATSSSRNWVWASRSTRVMSPLPMDEEELGVVRGDAVVVDHERGTERVAQEATEAERGVVAVARHAADLQRTVH